MKLEAGKYYKTRDGRKAYVQCLFANPFGELQPNGAHAAGFIQGDSPGAYGWNSNGHVVPRIDVGYDLVAEWREPETRTLNVVMVRWSNTGGVWVGEEQTLPPGNCKLLAQKRFTITEGEGMEDSP